ncbi:SHOCT domain-containing protein [Natrinema salsiterrestre]|uniref:SHOCT domain-containing protein n=1 Tax=Natrinema salsiterrestre TaxID=2950540 RepID=A0A9Q4Q3K9_9EURY|nr:SHOCT domain-containing protein [Natrinema salsiterrestre]MDF9746282.1 SHOCT domain-containing protein [Natrinema salsiterrestre]
MTQLTTHVGRTARRLTILAVPLLVAATGTAVAHGGGSYGGGMMGGGGLFGGAMGLWGLLWMGLLIAVPLYLAHAILNRGSGGNDEQSLSVLRERYARGELSDDEFDRRRKQLERTG